jgi:hypothetical protein
VNVRELREALEGAPDDATVAAMEHDGRIRLADSAECNPTGYDEDGHATSLGATLWIHVGPEH